MLQKIREGLGRWIAGIILGLLAVAFVFWGVDFTFTGSSFAARVNGEEIPIGDFERELQTQQSQYQDLYRIELTEDVRREIRRAVIERLIRNKALSQRVEEAGYRISDERLAESIRSLPAFQVDGQFSLDLYRSRLMYENLVPAAFEQLQRDQLQLIELQSGIADSTFLTPAEFRRFIELFNQRRQIAYALFDAERFLDPESIDEEAIVAHYEANKDRYRTEEAVDLEYIELTRADVAASVEVSDAELRAHYEQERERFETQEERHARHILIASPEEDPEAQARAQEIVDRIEAGEEFEALASELSEDPGTRAAGGDLGWIGRGMLAGPFEDALFEMETGEVRGPVKTDFGYHVIRLDEIRAGQVQTFEQAEEELRAELREERADQLFFDRANELADRAFDAVDELATVAGEMDLPLAEASRFPRSGDETLFPNSAAVVQVAFSPEVLETGENSELVQLSEDHVMVLRVTEHYPSAEQPLDDVRDQIRGELAQAAAEQRAADAAAAFLAALEEGVGAGLEIDGEPAQTGEAAADAEADETMAQSEPGAGGEGEVGPAALAEAQGGTWTAPRWVERADASAPTEVLAAAFRLAPPAEGQVVRTLVPLASGDQAVLVMTGVQPGSPESMSQEERDLRQRQLAEQASMYDLSAYATKVREEATVRIPDQILNPPTF